MAVSFVAASSDETAGVDSASLTIAAPSGLAAGDVMYAGFVVNSETGLTAPSGWTAIQRPYMVTSTPAGGQLSVYRKVAVAADVGANFTWTKTVPQKWVGTIVAVRDASPSTPEIGSVTNSVAGGAAATAASTGTISSAVSGQMVLDFYGAITDPSGTPSFTAGSGSERADANDTAQAGVQAVTGATSAPGTAGTSTISSASAWASVRIVIGPRYWETPNAPTLVTPVGGVPVVRDENQTFTHAHSHPDSGDTQSAAQHRFRVVGTSTWTTETIASSAQSRTVTGGTLDAGNHEWQARTASSLGTYGSWSASSFFESIDAPDPPVITSHVDDDVVGALEVFEFTLSATATQIGWRRVADSGGSPDTATVYDSDTITGNVRSATISFDTTGRTEHVQIRAEVDGVDTDWESVRVEVTFTPPDEPTHTTTADTPAGAITIDIENAASLMGEAHAHWAASQYAGSGSLLDLTGNGHDLALPGGSNDPTFLAYSGTKYVFLPGGANYLSVPDAGALDIVGDIDIRVRRTGDLTPAADSTLAAKWGAGDTRSWWFGLLPNGRLAFYSSVDGVANNSIGQESTSSVTGADTDTIWMRVTVDVDNGAGQKVVTFYQSPDNATWSTVSTHTIAGTTSFFASTADLTIGAYAGGSERLIGKIHRAQVYNGIAGSLVLDIDPSVADPAASTFAAVTGQTVTIVRTSTGPKAVVVDRDLFLFGTDDYLTLADHADFDVAAGDSFTVAAVYRTHGAAAGTVIAKRAGTAAGDVGWCLDHSGGGARLAIGDGAVADASNTTAPTASTVVVMVGLRKVATDHLDIYEDGASSTAVADDTTATLANSEALRVGRLSGAGTGYADMEFMAAAFWRRALTGAEIATLTAAFVDAEPIPDADHNDVWRREADDIGIGIRVAAAVASDGSFVDYTVASGQDYEYRVEAIAANGASSFSDWDA